MAEREVFPFADDRELIKGWLRDPSQAASTDWLSVTNKQLNFARVTNTIAWFDTAGALTVKLQGGAHYGSVVRVIIEIAQQLGIKTEIVRERFDNFVPTANGGSELIVFQYYIDGVPVTLDQAHVLVGPMGMMAWRESVK